MTQATETTTTNTRKKNHRAPNHLGEMEVTDCKFLASNKIEVSLKSSSGTIVTCTLTTVAMLNAITLAVAAINSGAAQVMGDLQIF
jgi:hypothetical protein